MCTILSYEKCSCFLFLVILAVFSSGFPIDNVAMTDFSKRNSRSHTSLVNSHELTPQHRIRHQRTLSSPPRHKRRKVCPELDVSFKAYKADAVAVAKVESQSSNCKENCTVQFQVLEWLKNPPSYQEDRRFRLYFRNDKNNYCEYDDVTNRSHLLVRTKISPSKEYILFLKTNVPHNYSSYFVPEINKKKTLNVVKRVLNPKFRPKAVRIEKIEKNEKIEKTDRGTVRKKLRLQCRVQGFPFPIILWKRNSTLLHPNSRIRITQKKKRSTLVIRNFSEEDWGQYECVPQGVDGKVVRKSLWIGRPLPGWYPTARTTTSETPDLDRKPCDEKYKKDFCHNGGTCFYVEQMNELMCECAPGFGGHKCETKVADQSSTYRQTPLYTCKLGLYTKYDNC